jgi:TPP-dependent 2-oxoacid decarboxylase
MNPEKKSTVGGYLIERLQEIGIGHIFGVPGDYVLEFFDLVLNSDIELVGTCNELNAGYAADGYARYAGVGAVCVTYGVGGFSLANAVAGAMAERIPLIVISGGPALTRRGPEFMLHHTLPDCEAVSKCLEPITLASLVLKNAEQAPAQIDAAIRICLEKRGPVYIELPLDMVSCGCGAPEPLEVELGQTSDPSVLKAAIESVADRMMNEVGPLVVWAGHEIACYKAEDALTRLLDHTGLAVVSSRQAKGVVNEEHPGFMGVYKGRNSIPGPKKAFESAGCVLNLGVWPTSINTGGYTAPLHPARMINAIQGQLEVGGKIFEQVGLKDLIKGLTAVLPKKELDSRCVNKSQVNLTPNYEVQPGAQLKADRFFARLSRFLEPQHVVLPDTGGAMISAVEMPLPPGCGYVQQAYYLSIGYTVPAALGVALAAPGKRPLILVGDGAFQMTGQEVSTMIRLGINPIVMVWNNDGYQIERIIHEGSFNDLQNWNYSMAPQYLGGGWGAKVSTEDELEEALVRTKAEPHRLALIEVVTDRWDLSLPMAKAYEAFKARKK